ncbi:protein NRT1/ PTR FAMILY 5.8-like isoform X1 [Salvia splendens]|uniref:protein NRT1/ PTR FAMILY 5.8-like isoform X1 n=1 Tax=Salvia splendens TaxID=180675 RepID=UPI001C25A534|nr:protein NRT1/ PTR FAMILY 5.8-like isoform X1 [Salvia splendens]
MPEPHTSMDGGGGGLNKPCILLIIISGMERFAFKGVASNLVTYLTDVIEMKNSSAAKFVNSWVGFTSMLPLIVSMLADSYCDKYSTILASSVLYAAGLLALTSTAVTWPWAHSNKVHSVSSLCLSLYLISVGQGGYNPSLQAFGAEQLEATYEALPVTAAEEGKGSGGKSWFFQWWYFGVCCGSLLGVSVMSYIQDTYGWGLGFAIPALSMIVSIVMFLCGARFYVQKQSRIGDVSVFEVAVRAVKAGVSKLICGGSGSLRNEYEVAELELEEKAGLCSQDEETGSTRQQASDEPLKALEAAKVVLRLLPVWTMLLMFAVIFQQPATFFTKQGMTLRRNIGKSFKIPPAALQSSITISIIILMPWYNKLFIPLVQSLRRSEKGISVMERMGIGMFLSVVAMVIAALTERWRLRICQDSCEEVALSIFWLLPQYILLGISDIFTVVGMQEYFYSEVPTSMRTMGIALYTSVFGVGSFVSAILISVIEQVTSGGGGQGSWFSDDMAQARLDKYYWFLAFWSAFSLLAFLVFCKFFKR